VNSLETLPGRIDVSHILLTRFNVSLWRARSAPNERWLKKRVELFEKICMPSIVNQIEPPDLWVIFFDADSPVWLRQVVQRWEETCSFIHPVFCKQVDLSLVRKVVALHKPVQANWLLTTRIDNDDAVRIDFFGALRRHLSEKREFLNPVRGLVACNGKFYRKRDYSSPFVSLMEPWDGFDTVWKWPHHLIWKEGVVRQIWLSDCWLQVIHGDNLANRVRGVRVPIRGIFTNMYPLGFFEEAARETALEVFWDNTWGLMKRYVFSGIRWVRLKVAGHL
jgi:hypothetical protein